MMTINNIIVFFLTMLFYSCQNTSNPKTKISEIPVDSITTVKNYDEDEPNCVYKKSSKKIAETYPFSHADRITVVSYPFRKDGYSNDTLIVNKKFTVLGIKEEIQLTKRQIDTLFSILYDYKMERRVNGISLADCYTPRHSILFYKNNRPFAFYEVCLDCGGTRQTKNVDFGEFCSEKKCKIQGFFKRIGVKHGITDVLCF